MPLDPTLGVIVGAALSAGTTSWFGVRYTLNGTRERVKRIEDKLDDALKTQSTDSARIAVLEERTK